VKTGYTTLARNTFVGAARRNGHTLVVTMMNAPHGITEDASNLLTWTFTNYSKLKPVGTLVKEEAPPKTTSQGKPADKPAAGTARPARSRTVLSPGQAMQSLAFRVPVWAYAGPPVLLLGLFLRRPRTLRRRRH
jgi:D-alanyl-D-alanine carboxypeptidase (penicillin-binding protein 5/6)